MSKKSKIIISSIIVLVIIVAGYMLISKETNRKNAENAKRVIYDYMAKQGIKDSQLKYTTPVSRDIKQGGYFLATYVEGEKPNIYYRYAYRDNKVYFQAYSERPVDIKNRNIGGNRLSSSEVKKLNYPPFKN
jgi:hypothetical protein